MITDIFSPHGGYVQVRAVLFTDPNPVVIGSRSSALRSLVQNAQILVRDQELWTFCWTMPGRCLQAGMMYQTQTG